MIWTETEKETIVRLWSRGHTFAQIARELRRSRGAIAGKAHRLKLLGNVSKVEHSRRTARGMMDRT
jgi:hypothetical protein